MTKINNINDLKVGDEVTVTVKGRISHVYTDPDDSYANLDFEEHAEYISISDEYLYTGLMVLDRPVQPLPAKNGIYVPANNADYPEGSFLYVYDEQIDEGPWVVYTGKTIYHGDEAFTKAENAHNNLGGLTPLTVKG